MTYLVRVISNRTGCGAILDRFDTFDNALQYVQDYIMRENELVPWQQFRVTNGHCWENEVKTITIFREYTK